MPCIFDNLDLPEKLLRRSPFGLITDVDAFRAMRNASRGSDFQGLAIVVTSSEMADELPQEADFTVDGVKDVERLLKWISETAPRARNNTSRIGKPD